MAGEHKGLAGPATGRAAACQHEEEPVDRAVLGEETLYLVLVLEILWGDQIGDVTAKEALHKLPVLLACIRWGGERLV